MTKYIIYPLSICLIIGFNCLVSEKVFSQENQIESNVRTTNNIKTAPSGTTLYVTGMTIGRAKAIVGSIVGLISLVMGWRAKIRTGSKRTGAITAIVLGLISIILSVVHLSTSIGAVFGSGSGKAGAIVGLVFGVTGMILGGLAATKPRTISKE